MARVKKTYSSDEDDLFAQSLVDNAECPAYPDAIKEALQKRKNVKVLWPSRVKAVRDTQMNDYLMLHYYPDRDLKKETPTISKTILQDSKDSKDDGSDAFPLKGVASWKVLLNDNADDLSKNPTKSLKKPTFFKNAL